MLRNFVLLALTVGFVSCAPGMGSTLNQSKNPYVAARYEPLSSIKVKPGETTYATVSYSPQYLDGDFSKVVDRNIHEPDYPKEGDIYAGQLAGMFDVTSVTPASDVAKISIAYVEARREIGKVNVTSSGDYDNIHYKYMDSIEVTYKITLEKTEKRIPRVMFLDLRNNYNNSHKSIMLMLNVEGQSLFDFSDDDADEETPTSEPETPVPAPEKSN